MDPNRLVRSLTAPRRAGATSPATATPVPGATYTPLGTAPVQLTTGGTVTTAPIAPVPLEQTGTVSGANAARWTQYCGPGGAWVQHADLELADAWFRRARDLTATANTDRLNAGTWADQRGAVRAVWEALGQGYRALNLPPLSSPDYQLVMAKYYGNPHNRSSEDAKNQRLGPMSATGISGVAPGIIGEDLWRTYRRVTNVDLGPSHAVGEIFVRISLGSPSGLVQETCLDWPGIGECDLVPGIATWNGCTTNGGTYGCDPYKWVTWAWHDPPVIGVPAGDPLQIDRASPPLRWSWIVAGELARSLAGMGASQVLTRGRTYQILRNIAIVKAAKKTPDELVELSNSVPADLDAATFNNANMQQASAAIQTVGTIVSAIPGGQVYGLVIGAIGTAVRFLPSAVGFPTDPWGRAVPLLEQSWISGDATTPPAFAVPAPPGYVPPAHPAPSTCATPGGPALGGTVAGVPLPLAAVGIGGLALLAWWLLA